MDEVHPGLSSRSCVKLGTARPAALSRAPGNGLSQSISGAVQFCLYFDLGSAWASGVPIGALGTVSAVYCSF